MLLHLHIDAYKGPSLSSIKSTIRRRMNKHEYIPLDFNSQLEAGISSNTFNLDENITEDEARQGLDARGVEEIDRMMRREGLTFDQARLKRHNKILADNGISSDGKPKDPKFVSFD
ncbi:hypothetical protein E3Q22_02057 [Wallemia mellicola]|uniref:Uncharacterized protein n=2 Tax=Wallemia mellicola TaxID=1708541 RepID=A0A4T0NXX3_9BASI|nr:hypothetical protein E3Q24_03410 [Wallemia mellicola]TIB79445.1 hypothetical protein E3Q23_00242 [Wallemia mellicola]TIB80179.1 hypothetical protein E3Q22_02057 [Wallemia mellicola]TIB88339.1 hypothetical protein E3Q21_00995 [Wallemia mellicola]TIB91167.1 hypothetical protein E3Q20_00982 [Wallemia mellicola]